MDVTVIEENVALEITDTSVTFLDHQVSDPVVIEVNTGGGFGGGGGSGTIVSVNGQTVPNIVLTAADVDALPETYVPDWATITSKPTTFAPSAHTHPQSDVINLDVTLASKADDAAVVKLSDNQTIGGTKTFSAAPTVPDGSFTIAKTTGLQTALDAKASSSDLTAGLATKADDTAVVKLTGTQTISGAKTFSASPTVPDASFAQSKVIGLTTALTAKADDTAVVKLTGAQTIAGVKTFSSAPVVPANSFAIAAVTSLQTTLDAKALASATVNLSGAQTVAGVKTFTSPPNVPDASFTIAKTASLQTTLDAKAAAAHEHNTIDILDDVPFGTSIMPSGYVILVVKADDLYGAAGSWPATRPGRADQYCHWVGDTDPGVLATDYDLWTAT